MEVGLSETTARAAKITRYEDLEVYQRSFALLRPVHDLARAFPDFEKYALADQMRRASRSVPTNIAEGYSRRQSPRDFRHFLAIAMGSANEMVVHLRIVKELGYADTELCDRYIADYDVVGRQLHRLIDAWRRLEDRPTSNVQPQGDQ